MCVVIVEWVVTSWDEEVEKEECYLYRGGWR